MDTQPSVTSRVAPLLEVWLCSGCEHQYLSIRYRGGLFVEHEVTRQAEFETIAAGGWRLSRRCRICGGIISLLYAHAAYTQSGKLLIFRDRAYGDIRGAGLN